MTVEELMDVLKDVPKEAVVYGYDKENDKFMHFSRVVVDFEDINLKEGTIDSITLI